MANEPQNSKLRILILEDVETDVELMKCQLRKAGIEYTAKWVDRKHSFERALQVFKPDVVLSDLELPRFSGMDALAMVRERAPSTPVIIVTGAVDDETAVDCIKAGAEDYVLKDRLNRLGPAIESALEKRRARDERARAEEALRESERHFRCLIENAQDIIFLLDEDRVFRYTSPAVGTILGYSAAELDGTSAIEFMHPDDRESVVRMLTQAFAKPGAPQFVTHRIRCQDGTYRVVESAASVMVCDDAPRRVVVNSRDVTDWVQAQTLLQESEQRFRAVAQSAGDAIVCSDADGTVTFWNDAAEKAFGYAEDEIVGQPFTMLIPERFRQIYTRDFEKAGRACVTRLAGKPVEFSGLRKDGTEFPLERTLSSWTTGENLFFTAIIRDITERKRAEDALRESQEKYKNLVDNLPAITYTSALDKRSTQVYVSPQVQELLGLSPAEFIADPALFANCLHPDDRERVLAAWIQAHETGHPLDLQYRMIHRNGSVRWFWEKATVLRERDDRPCNLQGIMLDITESKEVERERDLLGTAIEQSTDLVIITGLDGTIHYVNPAFEQITGYSRSEAVGQNPRLLQSGEHTSQYYREMWSVLTRGEPWSAEFTNKRKDGTTYQQRSTIFPIRDASGATVNYVSIGQDVSEQRNLEHQLRHAQKMEAVGQLTGGIAHDFNNILTAVLANAELIAADAPPSHREVHQSASEICVAAQRGASLVSKLMAFSRQQQLRKEPLDLTRLCKDTWATLRRVLPETIDLQIDTDGASGNVEGDRNALEQILFNLATNARDAMPNGGTLRVRTHRVHIDEHQCPADGSAQPGDYVCISMIDTGVGMNDETQNKIFEPFFTTKPLGVGTGLGMAMVHGLVKQHNGFTTVDSELGLGTTISVYLPAASAEINPKPPPPELSGIGGTETILFVEDDELIRRSVRLILQLHGYRCITVSDGERALATLATAETPIDLVITDIVMPELGGQGLYEEAMRIGYDAKFLFTSGYAAADVGRSSKIDPSVPFLAKPWTAIQLARKIRDVLDGQRAVHDNPSVRQDQTHSRV